ncbi:MAG: DUF1778 domain-containing protein [Terriglobia bacterium]
MDRCPGKRERLETRVTADQKRLIERGARLRRTCVTDFLAGTAQQAASENIKQFEVLRLRAGRRRAQALRFK